MQRQESNLKTKKQDPSLAPKYLWLQRELRWAQHFIKPEQWNLLGLGADMHNNPNPDVRVRKVRDLHTQYPEGVRQWTVSHVPGGSRPIYSPSCASCEILPPVGTLSLYPEHAVETGLANGSLTDARAFEQAACKPLTLQERQVGRVIKGVYKCPIMKLSFGTNLEQCNGNEIDVSALPENPCVVTDVYIGVSIEVLVRRGERRAYVSGRPTVDTEFDSRSSGTDYLQHENNPNMNPRTTSQLYLQCGEDADEQQRLLQERYFSRPADALTGGIGEEIAIPFEWYSHPFFGPPMDMQDLDFETLEQRLNDWAYNARQFPEMWDVVGCDTVSSDAVRRFLCKRVNSVSFPKFCTSPQQHPMMKFDISAAEIPPFCLERSNMQVCHSCKFHFGDYANHYQVGHASVLYTCASFCCFVPVCESCIEGGVTSPNRRASMAGNDMSQKNRIDHFMPPNLLAVTFEFQFDREILRSTPMFQPTVFSPGESEAMKAEQWRKVWLAVTNLVIEELQFAEPVDRRAFVQLPPINDEDHIRFAILSPAVTQHVFGRKDNPEGEDLAEWEVAGVCDDDAAFEMFDMHQVSSSFVSILENENLRQKHQWLKAITMLDGKREFYGDLSPVKEDSPGHMAHVIDEYDIVSDASFDMNNRLSRMSSELSIPCFDPSIMKAVNRLIVSKVQCPHCGQWYGRNDGGKAYHNSFVCPYRKAPEKPKRNSTSMRPHVTDRRRSSLGADADATNQDMAQAMEAHKIAQKARLLANLVYGYVPPV